MDNVISGSNDAGGYTFATDDLSGVHHPYTKLEFGPDGTATKVSTSDPLPVEQKKSGTATLTQVADTASSTTLLSSNTSRISAIIHNDSTAALYVGLTSSAVSTSAYSFILYPGDFVVVEKYTGQINGIWASDPNTGGAKITEIA